MSEAPKKAYKEDQISPELREGIRKWAEARAINGLKQLSRRAMSNEAPKRVWVDEGMIAWAQYSEDDIPYIRADIVDELVEALKGLQVWTSLAIHNEYVKPMIEDALAKLEESHE